MSLLSTVIAHASLLGDGLLVGPPLLLLFAAVSLTGSSSKEPDEVNEAMPSPASFV